MITPLLIGFLFGCTAFFSIYFSGEKKKINKKSDIKWFFGIVFAIVGTLIGTAVALNIGRSITDKCLAKNEVRIIEKHELKPLCGRGASWVYIVTGEDQRGRRVACYLENGELKNLFGENYNKLFDKGRTILSNDNSAIRQVVRPIVGAFWKHFAIISTTDRFVIPYEGLQMGSIKTIYEFVPAIPY